jgi:iron complex outermembrane recepter protein
VVVEDEALSAADEAAENLDEVSGGANLVLAEDLSRGTVGTIDDVLDFQPGIYSQSVNGGEATRLSIRGSGIVRSGFLFGWGSVLNLDGQRLYGASGNPYEAVEPLALDHVEVLRGANAFEYGPISLGGSINYVTRTGYSASPFQARFELGSFGYRREQVSTGGVSGPLDYYFSVTRFDKRGFRDNTESHSTRFVSSLGYRINKNLSTRFFFRLAEQYQQDAGFLTRTQLKDNRKQSQFGQQIRDRVNPGTVVLGNTTIAHLDARSSLEIGTQYDSSPIDTPNGGPTSVYFDFQQLAGSFRYKRTDNLFGHTSRTLLSFVGHRVLKNRWEAKIKETGQTSAVRPAQQADYTFLATNESELVKRLWLGVGIASILQHRETSVTSGLNLVGQSLSRDYENFAPKIAVRYELTDRSQVFANASRSIDTPSANSYIRTDALYVPQEFLNLNAAKADTIEVGTRGQESIVRWNASFYRSWVKDELLTVQIAPAVTTSSNASPTIHQGVEAGVDVQLWRQLDKDDAEPSQQIVLRQSYTWNDFHFRNDALFGRNQLAGVPIHLYQVELAYEQDSGFYVGVSAEASLQRYAADFANTIHNPAYAIVGARLGYQQPKKGLEAFVELRNLLDRRYSPVVAPIFNAQGVDSPVFAPGEGRAINGGLAYRF